ncbi:YbaB/EbfC family nucleoid-associated protein [Plantactinospora sp. WMMB782]|uniref:YbaB/EbfC family nucleoid-associated protein n=1 Tax=Plantactinospora sp. WMMB782 TaxID=3404121 RepID=UPI003B94398B
MTREIDQSWVEEAIERYRRIEALRAEFDEAIRRVQVTVRSPDGLVELVVTADGSVSDLRFVGAPQVRTGPDLARSIRAAITAADDAARWAREKLHTETFGGYRRLAED